MLNPAHCQNCRNLSIRQNRWLVIWPVGVPMGWPRQWRSPEIHLSRYSSSSFDRSVPTEPVSETEFWVSISFKISHGLKETTGSYSQSAQIERSTSIDVKENDVFGIIQLNKARDRLNRMFQPVLAVKSLLSSRASIPSSKNLSRSLASSLISPRASNPKRQHQQYQSQNLCGPNYGYHAAGECRHLPAYPCSHIAAGLAN